VLSEEVELVVAPTVEGEIGILPHHTPLMTMLSPGELRARQGDQDIELVVTGGFLEVRPDQVIVLADASERAEDIDLVRAEEARKRAQEQLARRDTDVDKTAVEAALRRAIARIEIAQKYKRRGPPKPRI
jgi:F-type H+-transporting ATPase subunit epsilon